MATKVPPSEANVVTLPLIEEQLHLGTRTVDTGRGLRVHKRVDQQPVRIDERLVHEDVAVTHVPIDRLVGPDEVPGIRYDNDGATLVVPVLEEVLVLERRVRIKEELHITRVRREQRHEETIVLKSERIEIERFDEGAPAGSHSHHFGGNTMQHTLVAVFDNRGDAQQARDELLASGFASGDVGLSEDSPDVGTGTGTGTGTGSAASQVESSESTSLTGGIKHFFSDIFGSESSDHAQKYSTALTKGHHVLTVTAASEPEVERAADLVERFGPIDIDEKSAEWSGGAAIGGAEAMRMDSGSRQGATPQSQQADERSLNQQRALNDPEPQGASYQHTSGGASTAGTDNGGATSGISESGAGAILQQASLQGAQQRDTSRSIPLVEERLKVGKREVQRGGVRVYSRIVETPVNETIGLREEHVHVERHPVDEPVGAGDTSAFKEQSIELRETAEEAVVEKTARVVEEVVIGKDVHQRQEQISDTLRHTEVEIEQLGTGQSSDDDDYRSHYKRYYADSGAAYDDYAPAYGYGSSIARDAQYQGRSWDEAEPDIKSGWERGHTGAVSTWEAMKAAVRHGWDRMTSA